MQVNNSNYLPVPNQYQQPQYGSNHFVDNHRKLRLLSISAGSILLFDNIYWLIYLITLYSSDWRVKYDSFLNSWLASTIIMVVFCLI